MPATHDATYNRYRVGAGDVVFSAKVPHGNGERTIEIAVRPEQIIEIADMLRRTDDPDERGHVFYHFDRGMPFPCSSCKVRKPMLRSV